MTDELEVIQTEGIDVYQNDEKAAIDIQVATAKQYPRNVRRAVDNSIAIATMDKDTAETCNYSLPRGGKNVSGPSVHLARIIAQNWQNLRVESKVVNITNTQIVSQAICYDLETNYAVKIEVRKKITKSNGERYNEDMITLHGNVTNAIAFRNAVFAVIPKAVTEKVYKASKNMITGDLSSEEKLIKKRKQVLDGFKDSYSVTEEQILEVLGLNSINQIKQDEIADLIGLAQAIKDGDTTVADTFGSTKKAEKDKSSEQVSSIMNKLDKVKAKKDAEKAPEEKASATQQEEKTGTSSDVMKVHSYAEAKQFLIDNFGVSEDVLTTQRQVIEVAKEAGFNIKILPKTN